MVQVVAFATFLNHQSAITAMHALNVSIMALQELFKLLEVSMTFYCVYFGCHVKGVKFDPQAGSVLHIELARSNSRRKRKPGR